jgi:small subunit ribosomal protein S6
MRRYETIVIVDPDLSDDDRTTLFTRVKEIIPQQGGILIEEDLWGSKKLAYEIKKKPRGYYARFDYCGLGGLVDEMERFFRIDDRVMKYLTVQLAAEADAEQIQAEIAAAAETAEGTSAATTEETPAATAEAPVEAAPAETAEAAAEATSAEAVEAQAASDTASPDEDTSPAPEEPSEAETPNETSEKE